MRRSSLLLLLLVAGCGEDARELPSSARTAFGTWSLSWASRPDPIPLNAPFDVEAVVAGAGADVQLAVDASMPQHGHGMNRVPVIERREDGSWIARGLLFHMPGRWELAFDVSAGGITERAAVMVELE